jgi:hypothetical protein
VAIDQLHTSTSRPGTFDKCLILLVTNVIPWDTACDAIRRSMFPIGLPERSNAHDQNFEEVPCCSQHPRMPEVLAKRSFIRYRNTVQLWGPYSDRMSSEPPSESYAHCVYVVAYNTRHAPVIGAVRESVILTASIANSKLGGVPDLSERFLKQTLGNSPPLQRFG